MLPDLVGMSGAAMPQLLSDEVARGVSIHLATDQAFHQHATFLALASTATRSLCASGVRRPTALAVGHVGVEILIDCVLARDAAIAADFLRAVAAGEPLALDGAVAWAGGDAERYSALHATLRERGLLVGDPAPERVTQRLVRVLQRRPRLAILAEDRPRIAAWVPGALAAVEVALPALVASLREDLGVSGVPGGTAALDEAGSR